MFQILQYFSLLKSPKTLQYAFQYKESIPFTFGELSIEIQLIIKKGSSCVFTATYMCDGIDYCKILHAEQDVAYFLRHLSL